MSDAPPPNVFKLYHVVSPEGSAPNRVIVREVDPAAGLCYGDVYVLDKGYVLLAATYCRFVRVLTATSSTNILQFNMQGSSGKERFKAADFARTLANARGGGCGVTVSEQGAAGAGTFLAALGIAPEQLPRAPPPAPPAAQLFRLTEDAGTTRFAAVPEASTGKLASDDAFIVHAFAPETIFVWLGNGATSAERKTALRYGQKFLGEQPGRQLKTAVVRIKEGTETRAFLRALGAA